MAISSLNIGLSALQTDQQELQVIGNNIANAETPGYHCQVAQLAERSPNPQNNLSFGSGVTIADISRERDAFLEQAITTQTAQSSNTSAQLEALQQIQSQLAPAPATLGACWRASSISSNSLSSQPSDTAQRQTVLGAAMLSPTSSILWQTLWTKPVAASNPS